MARRKGEGITKGYIKLLVIYLHFLDCDYSSAGVWYTLKICVCQQERKERKERKKERKERKKERRKERRKEGKKERKKVK